MFLFFCVCILRDCFYWNLITCCPTSVIKLTKEVYIFGMSFLTSILKTKKCSEFYSVQLNQGIK